MRNKKMPSLNKGDLTGQAKIKFGAGGFSYNSEHSNIIRKFGLFFVVFVLFLGVLGFGGSACADILVDYENGSIYSASGGHFIYYAEDRSVLTLDATQGFNNTDQSLNVNTLMDNFHIWYIQNMDVRPLIPEAYDCDRMSFFIKIPENYPLHSGDNNFHVGTYTRDPTIPSNIQGEHYYHYFNIQGSTYPTKFILNQHPQHHTGWSTQVPINNPETWNYYDGFTRFYLELVPLYNCPISLPFISHLDEVKFYSVSEPENDETINSISCTYFGDGNFQIGWHGNSLLWDEYLDHDYEVRYSLNHITNDNYSLATTASGGPFARYLGSASLILADFTIPITSGTAYFAIKDLDSTSSYVSKIDYPIDYMDLSITTSSLSEAIINEAYSQTVSTTGGNTPYSYSITSGLLPNGLSLNSATGLISGIPTQIGTSNFTVQVTDDDSNTDAQALSITVNNPDTTPPIISNIQTTNILSESATITWTTNENANSQVQYGTISGVYTNTETNQDYITSHSIAIYGLNPFTTYYYIVNSEDQSSNSATSAEYSFTTATDTSTILIDFGDSEADNVYGLTNWNTPLVCVYTNYRSIGPNGTTITIGSNGYYNCQGIQGISKQFSEGDIIKVNWYNDSANAITFIPQISFNDPDGRQGSTPGIWYNMTSTTIQPNSTAYSNYTFDSSSAGNYSLVNVNVNYDNIEVLICDKIKLTVAGADTTPPSRTNPLPAGTLTSGTTQTTISLTTNETATCKYSTNPNTVYDSIPNIFSSTNSTTHSQTITGLEDGNTYTYYIRCQDTATPPNQNPDDFNISFSIASHATYTISDFITLVSDWLSSGSGLESDVNGDGVVNTRDLGL